MPSPTVLRLLALASLALLAALGPANVAALSIDAPHIHLSRHHDIALRRDNATEKRCKHRSSHHHHSHKHYAPHSSKHDSTSGGMPKIGIAYPIADYRALEYFKTPKVGPFYNWSPYCDPKVVEMGFTCIPMLWGYKQIADFQRLVKPGYATHILGMNEPNEPSQSNMSPEAGVAMWKTYIDHFADEGYTLISPACTSAPSGKKWTKDFLDKCTGCRVHAIALHWYGIDAQEMIDYITDFHNTFQKDIWVTEFACTDFSGRNRPCGNVFGFFATVKHFMDSVPWVKGYFAFGVMFDMYNVDIANRLLGSNGQPTSLGWYYVNQY
ncbi:hypothetical protein APHAL10511_001987 [Amanita phalloides]|nr:hypothetical protein APHAL10511_001987 [Amanita phalloides]